MNCIQAFIVNMDLPHDLDELACSIYSSDSISNSIDNIRSTTQYYLEDENDENSEAIAIIGTGTLDQYSAPRHAMAGDICFFMCQRTAVQTYARLRKLAYELCETNLSYKEFCDWLTDRTAFFPKRGKKQLYRLFPWSRGSWPGLEADDYVMMESLAKDAAFLKDKANYSRSRDYGYDRKDYKRVAQLVVDKGYKYIRLRHYNAGAIISHLWWMFETVQQYAGKIYAVGVVGTSPEKFDFQNRERWRYGIVTNFEKCFLLNNPIDLSEFKDEVSFSLRGSFTYVLGPAFDYLKKLVASKNEVPEYFLDCVSVPVPLSKLNDKNWLEITNKHRRGFILEAQFRVYYVDRLLPLIGDKKTFYMECKCFHRTSHFTCVDNVIVFGGKYLPVEVKLNISIEKDLLGQCRSYCGCPSIEIGKTTINMVETWQCVLVIDREAAYLYSPETNDLKKIIDLDELNDNRDILSLRERIKLELDCL